eukprot:gnl/MRDRNA2_/MRDRNA2_36432_c0_seq1.p1 gnl/MRDRNA2_/MRDRNA2_36432_c0~~gnl/MRDRNA2_/MRDRNA2_36432_c0_seq1.p1  ORF type:complete len:263 (+),score=27.46 gnl/MRDRNA2_/MRDRNA2_36432_c0_seq1:72-860(+)
MSVATKYGYAYPNHNLWIYKSLAVIILCLIWQVWKNVTRPEKKKLKVGFGPEISFSNEQVSASYWERRYNASTHLTDYYAPYEVLKSDLMMNVDKQAPLLHVGGGTSQVAHDMWADGYKNITTIDISAVAVRVMGARHRGLRGVWHTIADVTSLPFANASFHTIFEKATMDVLALDSTLLNRAIDECWRVLRPGGVFILASASADMGDIVKSRVNHVRGFSYRKFPCQLGEEKRKCFLHFVFHERAKHNWSTPKVRPSDTEL